MPHNLRHTQFEQGIVAGYSPGSNKLSDSGWVADHLDPSSNILAEEADG